MKDNNIAVQSKVDELRQAYQSWSPKKKGIAIVSAVVLGLFILGMLIPSPEPATSSNVVSTPDYSQTYNLTADFSDSGVTLTNKEDKPLQMCKLTILSSGDYTSRVTMLPNQSVTVPFTAFELNDGGRMFTGDKERVNAFSVTECNGDGRMSNLAIN